MSSFESFSFGRNDESATQGKKRFKAQAGCTYRVSFVWWKGVEEGKLDLDADGPESCDADPTGPLGLPRQDQPALRRRHGRRPRRREHPVSSLTNSGAI